MEWYQMDAGKCLEFSKKMAVLRKLVRLELISENEYIRAKNMKGNGNGVVPNARAWLKAEKSTTKTA